MIIFHLNSLIVRAQLWLSAHDCVFGVIVFIGGLSLIIYLVYIMIAIKVVLGRTRVVCIFVLVVAATDEHEGKSYDTDHNHFVLF